MNSSVLDLDVAPPKSVQDELDYMNFVSETRKYVESIKAEKRKELGFELTCFVCSLAELYFHKRKCGSTKKNGVLDALKGLDTDDNLNRMIELALQSKKVVKKNLFRTLKLSVKKLLKKVLN